MDKKKSLNLNTLTLYLTNEIKINKMYIFIIIIFPSPYHLLLLGYTPVCFMLAHHASMTCDEGNIPCKPCDKLSRTKTNHICFKLLKSSSSKDYSHVMLLFKSPRD